MEDDTRVRKFSTSSGQFRHKKKTMLQRIQITQWLPQYTKVDFVSDLVAGITVGLTMIPQSIAYAGLAALPPQYGLYTAFIGSYTYVLCGSIKQVSIGPTSLIAMLLFTYLHGHPVEYIILLTFFAGCVELTMGVLNLGFLVDFISPPVSSGFTCAISINIMISQIKPLLGLHKPAHSLLELLKSVTKHAEKVSVYDTVIGISAVIFLIVFKKLPSIKMKNKVLKKLIWFLSISRNALIVLLTSSVAYYYYRVDGKVPFVLSPKITPGIPSFSPPKFSSTHNNQTSSIFDMVQTIGSGIFVIPICAILGNIVIAKSFASGVIVDASQEMISLGLCNIFGSFVQAMPSSGAFSRSAVLNASGVRTPLHGLYSGTIILLALSFLTPYFGFIPKATLAAVLMSAVASLIDYAVLPVLWRTNKLDFGLYILTCCIGVTCGSDIGIITGAVLNLLVLLKEWSRPDVRIKLNSLPKSSRTYILIKPELGFCYPARDFLVEKVIETHSQYQGLPMVLDCSCILKLDYAAAEAFKYLLEFFNNDLDQFILINVNARVLNTLQHLMDTDKVKYCYSGSMLCDEMFEIEERDERKTPLLPT